MKTYKTRLLQILLALAPFGALPLIAAEVDLFLKPDIKSPKVARVQLGDARLGQPLPVMDEAKASLGWNFADFHGMVEAYVPDAKIGKDLLPVDNAILYSGPGESSTVLATYRFGQPLEVVDTGLWWKVRYGGGIPVYFVLDSPPPLPPVTGTGQQVPVATQVPAPAPAPQFEETVPLVDGPSSYNGGSAGSSVPRLEPQAPSRPGVIGQSYEGTFRRSKRFLGMIPPKAPFYLEGSAGQRIAWVDVSGIVIPGSMKEFLDKAVILHGERDLVSPKSRDWIIHARNMRLK